jgi:diguanylate cyclase (GGDEF)-like protein
MRWPTLSIRSTVAAAIALGVLLPAVLVVAVDHRLSRTAHEPLVQRNRAAVQVLGAAILTEPAWTLSEPGLQAAAEKIVDEPSVCAVQVLDLQPVRADVPFVVEARRCDADVPVTVKDVPVLHEGQQVARLRLSFDDTEVDRLLAERRGLMWWLVPAQVLAGVLVLMGVLSLRLLRPIDRLKAQASALVSREPTPALEWRRRDELGQLGQHLNDVRERLLTLFGELESKNAELHMRAMFDDLTGLPNRTLFRELAQHQLAAARRAQGHAALLFIDLDRFKQVNDTLGHAAGDELLLALSRRMQSTLRESDVVCRLGGDEFLVLLAQTEDVDAVRSTAERLLHEVGAPVPLPRTGGQAQVSASIGIAIFPGDGDDFDALVQHADLAMFRIKQSGRAGLGFYQAERDNAQLERLALERELADGIDRGELRLHFQPVVEADDGRIVGCEALVRWQHPQRGLLLPGHFIALAEHSGLIRRIGAWTLDAACAQIAAWDAEGLPPLAVSVNVSALQLHDQALPEQVRDAVQRHGIAPARLELELTESALLSDRDGPAIERALAQLEPLRALGVGLAVDDFGTGYSSLSYLKLLKPDKLKIDRSFVRDLPGDVDDHTLTQAIVALARALDIEVVAEGVETEPQRACLRAMGCRRHQGWLYGRAVPAEQIGALFADAGGATAEA